jgi:transposase
MNKWMARNMTKAVSRELREKIVKCYDQGIGTIEEIAKLFEISARSVGKYIALDRKNLSLTPRRQTGRPPILTQENLKIIKLLVSSKIDSTLQEHADAFYEKTKIRVTFVTIHNACKKLNICFKKKVFTRKK